LERDYRFILCTMTFPDYCEDVVARMSEFGKPLGDSNFAYMRVTDVTHSIHYFYFNAGVPGEIRGQRWAGL
jgi:hypothetical protein